MIDMDMDSLKDEGTDKAKSMAKEQVDKRLGSKQQQDQGSQGDQQDGQQ